jgi:hypothetical protein
VVEELEAHFRKHSCNLFALPIANGYTKLIHVLMDPLTATKFIQLEKAILRSMDLIVKTFLLLLPE